MHLSSFVDSTRVESYVVLCTVPMFYPYNYVNSNVSMEAAWSISVFLINKLRFKCE